MPACNIQDTLDSAACFQSPGVTPHQQKQYIAYLYFLWASVIGEVVPSGPLEWTEFAKCYQTLTDDQVRAIEIQAILNGISVTTPTELTPDQLNSELKCISGLSDAELDRITVAFKCVLFGSLGLPA